MQISIHRLLLKDVITKLKYALASKPLNPILGHFVFDNSEAGLTIKATDGMISCMWSGKSITNDTLLFSIDGSLLVTLIPTLKGDIVNFEQIKDRDYKLTCDTYEMTFTSGNLKDYPKIDLPDNLKEITLPTNFSDMLKLLEPSVGNPKIQTNYKGLCLEIGRQPNYLEMVATDNLRLSFTKAVIDITEHIKMIIPKEAIEELIRLTPTSMFFDSLKKKAYFKNVNETGTTLLNTLLYNFTFSNVSSFLDTTFEGVDIKLTKSNLMALLKRLKCTTEADARDLFINLTSNKLFANTKSFQTKSKESLDLETPPDINLSFSLNLVYLLDYLKVEKDDNLTIKVVKDKFLLIDKPNFRHVLSINT